MDDLDRSTRVSHETGGMKDAKSVVKGVSEERRRR